MTSVLTDSLPAIYETNFVAQGDIREIFEFSLKKKTIKIAGCRVDSGKITKGHECGITFENGFENYEAGDKIMVYEKVRVPRFL